MIEPIYLGILITLTSVLLVSLLLVTVALVWVWSHLCRYRDLRITRDDSGEVMATALLRSPPP